MALSPNEQKQVGTDFRVAGFATSYGGSLAGFDQQNFVFTAVVIEAVDEILAASGIKAAKPQQREQLYQSVGQIWYYAFAGAVVEAGGGDTVARANYAHARARVHALDTLYPPARAALLKKA